MENSHFVVEGLSLNYALLRLLLLLLLLRSEKKISYRFYTQTLHDEREREEGSREHGYPSGDSQMLRIVNHEHCVLNTTRQT
jgi:hypothetical protein